VERSVHDIPLGVGDRRVWPSHSVKGQPPRYELCNANSSLLGLGLPTDKQVHEGTRMFTYDIQSKRNRAVPAYVDGLNSP